MIVPRSWEELIAHLSLAVLSVAWRLQWRL